MAERENGTEVIEPVEAATTDTTTPDDIDWDAIVRPGDGGRTGSTAIQAPVDDTRDAAIRAEQERLAAERQARREARLAALQPEPQPVAAAPVPLVAAAPVAAPAVKPRRTTDRFLPSLGLFVLRLALAAIVGLHGLDKLLNPQRAAEEIARTVLPEPQLLALVVGVAEVGIAIALIFGLLTRVAALGVVLVAGGALAFVHWGPWSPFVPGKPGFMGELELILAAAGLLLLCTGAGGWAVDRGFRARRSADRVAEA